METGHGTAAIEIKSGATDHLGRLRRARSGWRTDSERIHEGRRLRRDGSASPGARERRCRSASSRGCSTASKWSIGWRSSSGSGVGAPPGHLRGGRAGPRFPYGGPSNDRRSGWMSQDLGALVSSDRAQCLRDQGTTDDPGCPIFSTLPHWDRTKEDQIVVPGLFARRMRGLSI